MKIHKNCKVELASSKDKSRIAISEPYLDVQVSATERKGTLVATDGKIMVQTPVEITTEDVSGFVSAEVLKMARKVSPGDNADVGLNGKATLLNGATLPREGCAGNSPFPNWRQVWPGAKHETKMVIFLDAKRLWLLAQAMGTEGVKIQIDSPDKPFLVFPIASGVIPANDDARGIISPILDNRSR